MSEHVCRGWRPTSSDHALGLVYSPQALADLEGIFRFIAADSIDRAEHHIAEIRAACVQLQTLPMMGVSRHSIRADLRILPLWRRVVVAYRVLPDRVDILRVFTAGQNYAVILGEGG